MSPPRRQRYCWNIAFATGCRRVGRRKWTNRRIRVPAFMRSCRIEEELTWVKTFGKEVEEYVTKVIAKDGTVTRFGGRFPHFIEEEEEKKPKPYNLYGFVDLMENEQVYAKTGFAPHRIPQSEGNHNGWLSEEEEADSDSESTAKLQSKVEAEAPLGPLSLSGEKVTILSCLVSAFSPPLFSPRLGRFFRFFNESLHESCNRIKDILSSRSVCLMPSIESIGAISSLGGRAIDSSCPWLVKGMRQEDEDEGKVESSDRGTMKIGVDMVAGIDILDGMLMFDDVEHLEQVEEVVQDIYEHVIEIPLQRVEDIESGHRELEAKSLIAS
ncbi:hypothetical protein Tco_1206708 [Tanacetum coccineum]